jgi:preprotein translocase subunit SecD
MLDRASRITQTPRVDVPRLRRALSPPLVAVCLTLIAGCTSRTSTTPAPRASFQARQVLQIVPPSSPIFGELKPTCAEPAGCPGLSIDPSKELVAIDKSGDRLQLGPAFVAETDISQAEATQIGGDGPSATVEWAVAYRLTPGGTDALAAGASRALDKPPPRDQIAIVVNGVVAAAIVVRTAGTRGEGTITGNFTEDSARSLASALSP